MSSTQPTTFQDLWLELGQRLRLTTSLTSIQEQLQRAINVAISDMHDANDYKFPWCERETILRTKAPYSTGTVSISVGSTSLTGSGTAWNTSNGYAETNVEYHGKFVFEGSQDIYRVSASSSDTACTLTQRYVGTAALSGATYTYYEDEYELASNFLRPVDFHNFSSSFQIQLLPRNEFRRRFPISTVSGRPRFACIVDAPTTPSIFTPVRHVYFYPYPDKVYLIPYNYITTTIGTTQSGGTLLTSLVNADDVPLIPLRYRHAIVYHALYHWYRDKKDDARSQEAKAEYTDIMQRLINDQEVASHTQTRLVPAVGSYHSAAKMPYSYRGGRRVYDLNDEFNVFKR